MKPYWEIQSWITGWNVWMPIIVKEHSQQRKVYNEEVAHVLYGIAVEHHDDPIRLVKFTPEIVKRTDQPTNNYERFEHIEGVK